MTGNKLTSFPDGVKVVSDPDAAAFLSDAARQHYLRPFMLGETTLSQMGSELALPLNLAHYWAQKLLRWGLIHETRRVARAGRPIRYYQANAPAFFVPFQLTPAVNLEAQLLEEALSRQRRLVKAQVKQIGERPVGHGVLVTLDPQSVRALRRIPLPDWDEKPQVFNVWLERPLTAEHAARLRQELQDLTDRYASLPEVGEQQSEMFLLHVGLAELA